MKGQNTCQWLVIGSTELCDKELFGGSLQDSPRPPEMRFQHTAMHIVWQGCQKNDSGYALTVVTIKLKCVPGKGVIGLSWPSLNIWGQSKFPFRQE